mgnify:FL=1
MDINFLLFEQFETLDLFGPVEICGRHPDFQLHYISQNGGLVTSTQGVRIDTKSQQDMNVSGVLVIPGGAGTRTLIKEEPFLKNLRRLSEDASFVLSVCTGSALLARCGILEGKRATSNKRAFDWVVSTSDKVHWIRKARWVHDGKFYTSSGISAGMDMTLGFIRDRFGAPAAERIACRIHMEQKSRH